MSFAATIPIPRPLKRAGAIPFISTPFDLAQSTNWVCCSPGSSAAVMAAVKNSETSQLDVRIQSWKSSVVRSRGNILTGSTECHTEDSQ